MVQKDEDGGWSVCLVDLDWAGIVGRDTYPFIMSDKIPWHQGAQPGLPLQKEHDWHLFRELF